MASHFSELSGVRRRILILFIGFSLFLLLNIGYAYADTEIRVP
jgi:hypothetical protein